VRILEANLRAGFSIVSLLHAAVIETEVDRSRLGAAQGSAVTPKVLLQLTKSAWALCPNVETVVDFAARHGATKLRELGLEQGVPVSPMLACVSRGMPAALQKWGRDLTLASTSTTDSVCRCI